ncbi:MHC class II transactivator [Lampris incognitus]|uniref:MHC class II transactivator n=1 Tax=Lampris incognitus TaxID=2546036 RepID=UPI0024B5FC24|nr:MHC class II transactivator [Lampris incognitus]
MQEEGTDPPPSPDYGDLPELDFEGMVTFWDMCPDPEELFDLGCLSSDEDQDSSSSDISTTTALPKSDRPLPSQTDKMSDRQKRLRDRCAEEDTPSWRKRQRRTGQSKSRNTHVITDDDEVPELSPADEAALATPPPQLIELHPSLHLPIQLIPLSDPQIFEMLSNSSHPVIRFPLSNTATPPKYIFVDGAVAPVLMGSSPPGSLSDSASKALSPSSALSLSSSMELTTCKESPPPPSQPSPVLDVPGCVREYIVQAKAHIKQTCMEMGMGLRLTSHYVDTRLTERKCLFSSGKISNKCLEKKLVIMGDVERQRNSLGRSQIFEASPGAKPKRTVLLLGNAGMGKTTLMKKLCCDWSDGLLPQFDFVFLLDGKALTLPEPDYNLWTLLFHFSPSAPPCTDSELVFSQITAAPHRVLIMFDGFDELRHYELLLQTLEKDLQTSLQKDSKKQAYTVKQLYSAILQRVLLPGCTLLISSRPRGTANQLLRRVDIFLELCGFTSMDIKTYLLQYFSGPTLGASAMKLLESSKYLFSLCWHPALCQLVCSVLAHSDKSNAFPNTLTELCYQALELKKRRKHRNAYAADQTHVFMNSHGENVRRDRAWASRCCKKVQAANIKARHIPHSCSQTTSVEDEEEMDVEDQVGKGERGGGNVNEDRTEESNLLFKLSSLAWQGVKTHSPILPPQLNDRLKRFGLSCGLFQCHRLWGRPDYSIGEREGGRREGGERERNAETTDSKVDSMRDSHILSWANSFLQSFLAAVHLSLSRHRTAVERSFLQQTSLFESGSKGRRRTQREEMHLTQKFFVGLLLQNKTNVHEHDKRRSRVSRDTMVTKRALLTKRLESLSPGDLTPAKLLEVCQCIYNMSVAHRDGSRDSSRGTLAHCLARNLLGSLSFHGVALDPPDVFVVGKVLGLGGPGVRISCLDLEDTGIQISGIRTLVGLSNICAYRACIADVIALWEELEESGEEELLQGAVSKFTINPLRATRVCHIEDLAHLVSIHTCRRLTDRSSKSDAIFAEGVPAVGELLKLEFDLGPENGPLALPLLCELLPRLCNLQHLDLENSKIGDSGVARLAEVLQSMSSLEILNLSQSCIGDQGLKDLAPALGSPPSLHCLSLCSNLISDVGAKSLAAFLPQMASLTDLDVMYNKLTNVGAESLGASLRHCPWIRSLRMWNQYIPCGTFERLQQRDHRILYH